MKALVVCGDSIADTVFSTPVIRALKVQLDDITLHGVFSVEAAFLMEENPYIDRIHTFRGNFWSTWNILRKEKFSIVVNLRTDWLSVLWVRLIRLKIYQLPSLRWECWLMVNFKINKLQNIHLVDRMMNILEPEGIKPDELGLDFFIPEKDRIHSSWLPEGFQKNYIVVSLAAPYATRVLPEERLIELCDRINGPIILLGSQSDYETGEMVRQFFTKGDSPVWEEGLRALNKKTTIYNACGKFNYNQMGSVIKQARAVFLFDGDMIPVSSAFRKEIYGLWGNTILSFGRYPYRTKFSTLENNRLPCRPCSSRGYNKCPKEHFGCMNDIFFDFYLP